MVELNFKPGDKVRFRLALEEIEGTVLESPDVSLVLLKLGSGYNIGIKKENILGCEIVKTAETQQSRIEQKRVINTNLPKIGLIITGGTIASKLDPKTGGVKPLTDADEFARFYPELFKVADVSVKIPFMLASESMSSENWLMIAEEVKKFLDDKEIRGVIITHGTDTLGYTAAALSFFLQNLNKPVVLTYSQRSIDRASSDANLNLQCAARMALSDAAEVMLVGHASTNDDYCYALRGSKVRKMHSSKRDAFKPINTNPIAKVWPDKIEFLSSYNKRDDKKTAELDVQYTDKVALVKFYPGQTPDILDFYALKYKGIVVEGTGLGHVAVSEAKHSWTATLKKHIKNGFVVCMTPQTLYGRVSPYVYTNLRELASTGAIFLEDMLPETAMVKLGFVLGHYGWKGKVKEKMLENMAGELELLLPSNSI